MPVETRLTRRKKREFARDLQVSWLYLQLTAAAATAEISIELQSFSRADGQTPKTVRF